MNDDDRLGSDDRDRIVDEFFAAHRSQVTDHGADEQTWQVVRERAGRGTRSRGVWFLGGVVAASAVAVAVLASQGLGGPGVVPAGPGQTPDPVVVTGPETPAPSTAAETPTPDGTDATLAPARTEEPTDTAAPTREEPVPGTFALPEPDPASEVILVDEPTGEDGQLRTTVYDVDCAAGEVEWHCPGLAVSEDGGQTWTARVDMYAAGYYAAVSSRERTWMWAAGGDRPGIPEVRRGLVRSDDGGRTWRELPTRGDGVLWVEAFRSSLVVVTQGCDGGGTAGCIEVVITDVAADDATTGRRVVTIDDLPPDVTGVPGPFPDGGLQATFDAVYVHLPWRGVSYRIADGEQVATPVERPGCTVTTAPESPDTLLALCQDDQLQISSDGGTTWQDVPGPGGDLYAVASNDGERLTVATDEALWVRDEAGAGWQEVMGWSPVGPALEALGGRSMIFGGPYRYDPRGDPASSRRWVTEDDWETWTEEPRIEITLPG